MSAATTVCMCGHAKADHCRHCCHCVARDCWCPQFDSRTTDRLLVDPALEVGR